MNKLHYLIFVLCASSALAKSFDSRIQNQSNCSLDLELYAHTPDIKNLKATQHIAPKSSGMIHADVNFSSFGGVMYSVSCPGDNMQMFALYFQDAYIDELEVEGGRFDAGVVGNSNNVIITNK